MCDKTCSHGTSGYFLSVTDLNRYLKACGIADYESDLKVNECVPANFEFCF